eukprot:29226-Pelagococcus_subviridis.AAC.2
MVSRTRARSRVRRKRGDVPRTRVVAARRVAREIRRDLRLRLAAESREHGSVPVRDAARRVFRERRDDDAPPREDVAVAVAVGDANHRRRIVAAVAVAVASLDVFSVAAQALERCDARRRREVPQDEQRASSRLRDVRRVRRERRERRRDGDRAARGVRVGVGVRVRRRRVGVTRDGSHRRGDAPRGGVEEPAAKRRQRDGSHRARQRGGAQSLGGEFSRLGLAPGRVARRARVERPRCLGERAELHEARPRAETRAVERRVRGERVEAVLQRESDVVRRANRRRRRRRRRADDARRAHQPRRRAVRVAHRRVPVVDEPTRAVAVRARARAPNLHHAALARHHLERGVVARRRGVVLARSERHVPALFRVDRGRAGGARRGVVRSRAVRGGGGFFIEFSLRDDVFSRPRRARAAAVVVVEVHPRRALSEDVHVERVRGARERGRALCRARRALDRPARRRLRLRVRLRLRSRRRRRRRRKRDARERVARRRPRRRRRRRRRGRRSSGRGSNIVVVMPRSRRPAPALPERRLPRGATQGKRRARAVERKPAA